MTPVELVQGRLGLRPNGTWDSATDGAVLSYQQRGRGTYPMVPHGYVDAQTLANLGYYAPAEVFPRGWAEYLAGGDKPGSLGRDLGTSIDQVPRWAWGVMAVVFGGVSYLTYRGDKKRSGR
jgi:hypothetical protein